ncbi:MAG: zf-HC2 domain-containing protein [Woeseiaceae bacterium]|nr:zf-HC2 domain-containing protein [Woeseiaceae bacterium]
MNDVKQSREHEEIDLLLPWYVNGTLQADERERVAAHLESCRECRASVALLSDLQTAVATNKTTPMVPRPRIDDLLDLVKTRKQPSRIKAINYLVAAAVVLAMTATLMVMLPQQRAGEPAQFETATSGQRTGAMDYVLDIRFAPDATESARQSLFQDIGAREISNRDNGQSFRVVVQVPANSLQALSRYTDSLEARPKVESVEVIALQLPMKSDQ